MAIKIIIHNVIVKDGNVLVLQRSKDSENLPEYWDIPGGSLEEGEDLREGVIRETLEESDITTTKPELFFYFSNYESAKQMQYITLVFKSLYKEGDVKINPEEHQDYKWLDIGELDGFVKNSKTPDYFPDLIKYINK